jgi:hypothetical protein
MVASANGELYPSFPPGMILDDGGQSSEDGSGLHSPIFPTSYPRSDMDGGRKFILPHFQSDGISN